MSNDKYVPSRLQVMNYIRLLIESKKKYWADQVRSYMIQSKYDDAEKAIELGKDDILQIRKMYDMVNNNEDMQPTHEYT